MQFSTLLALLPLLSIAYAGTLEIIDDGCITKCQPCSVADPIVCCFDYV
ncbi:hypothetical protein TUN199_07753 [Pyrenophora tritici-repentis]|nr:hypothetical protein PtrV1_13311 [Pyrenophora tritici-repentis]KAI0586031.1 hypothetical protein Alg215_02233 [Pyrenophora tritici-repentis]KAI0589032.1 hypothetical protein Alg130_03088 [Pyrenophora tritici-repentis]KAI0612643.1 hypothetical protein TUN205_03076 [Pyrenophora tritici-repentis]KAI0620265.1 hypothetical protein TUN199_07753 [Pyrenophora tritici-repentis]